MGDTITIEDKSSTNGTWVNSQRVRRTSLQPGTSFQLGHSLMKIEYKDEAEIRSEENLLYRASFDALTGIFNRQHFIKLASMELAYASRYRLPVGVIMIDIDNFKEINDSYGHQKGDSVLTQFANLMVANKRTEDIFARYGGEEFIILPRGEINKEDIYTQCERIRKTTEEHEFRCDRACIHIKISLGFFLKTCDSSDFESTLNDLIRNADKALYHAKKKGRNRTESFL
jgi:diguanylate cyclase (GGDEF)-like protein